MVLEKDVVGWWGKRGDGGREGGKNTKNGTRRGGMECVLKSQVASVYSGVVLQRW